MDADRDALLRRLLKRTEGRGRGLARDLRELCDVRLFAKAGARLIERNVAALTQTEDHKIEPSGCLNGSGDKPIIGVEKTADELMEMLKDRTDPVGKGLYEALKAQKDQAAADAVIAKIDAIGTVTLDSKSAIDEARAAYDKLTAAQ